MSVAKNEIQIKVNGNVRSVPCGWTIETLLSDLGLNRGQVAVEVNRQIVRRPDWGKTAVGEGDSIEIVHFVGGGEN